MIKKQVPPWVYPIIGLLIVGAAVSLIFWYRCYKNNFVKATVIPFQS